jgi:NADPH-dependent glutamate synthase beta subunit-like oxidoreductase
VTQSRIRTTVLTSICHCQRACPVHTDARGYVRAIAERRFEDAYLIARGPNPFASICGRICRAPCEEPAAADTSRASMTMAGLV